MKYAFSVGAYDAPELEGELALALDARSALGMRKRGAKPSARRPEKAPSAQGQRGMKILGIVFIILGAAAILYVTTMEQRSRLIQILGFLAIGIGMMVMRAGAPSGGTAHARPRSVQQAQKLLAALRQGNFANGLRVSFDDEKMTLETKSNSSTVAYDELHSVVETEHLWFISYGAAGVALQKCDLTEGNGARFLTDIAERSGCSTEIVYWPETEHEENNIEAMTGETT